MEDTALTTLRFDKEALESQLRKFASQCQHLEDEKLRIVHTFKSAKIEIVDDNIEKAVVSLCDKVASLEEECDSLAKFKSKAFSNEVELNTLQRHNTELSTEITKLQQSIDNLKSIELGHKNVILSVTETSTKLQHDVVHARQEAASMRHQLKFLEQENLQLMMDYKAAKQKIHGLKTDLNQLRSQMSTATIVQSSDVRQGSIKKPPSDKENVKESLNHNSEKNIIPPSSSAQKVVKPQTNKDDRRKPIADRLDTAFAGSDENTQECKQS
jgi:chromosome segregation ATPase